MREHTVRQVAKLSGVSVRALHHYDEIGLLKPAHVGANGYRYYGREELLRLQQILFHRELGMPLEEIRRVLDAPGFDRKAALLAHRERLASEARRYKRLLSTIDETLADLDGDGKMNEKAMYRGFDPEKQARDEAWLVEQHGARMRNDIEASKAKMSSWSQDDFDRSQAEIEAIETATAKALGDGLPPDSDAVGVLMRRLHAWVASSWKTPPTAEAFAGLADLYRDHPDFRARYEARATGLTEYLGAAMRAFAAREL